MRKLLLAFASALVLAGAIAIPEFGYFGAASLRQWNYDQSAEAKVLLASLFGGMGTNAGQRTEYTGLQLQTSAQGVPITLMWGKTRIKPNIFWYNDFKAEPQKGKGAGGKGGSKGSGNYTYTAAVMLGLCEGPITGIGAVWADQTMYATGGLAKLNLSICGGMAGPPYGTATQPVWPYLTTNHPTQAIPYAYLAYVSSPDYKLGSSAALPNHNFEVSGPLSTLGDANSADIINDFLTNPQYSIGLPTSSIDATSLAFYRTYCAAQNIFMSPALDSQEQISSIIDRWARLTNTWIFWSGNVLKFVPLGDSAISSGGNNYTPNLTIQYDLTYDDFIATKVRQGSGGSSPSKTGDGGPIQVTRADPADCPNHVKIEVSDRANQYNYAPVEWQDQGLVDQFGQIDAQVTTAHEICDLGIAVTVAQLIGQRSAYIRNTYAFKLGYEFALLEPGDLVSLTDPHIGLDKFPVRIRSLDEDESGYLAVVAEEFPGAVGTAP